jgi:hypothetical protein
VDIPLNFLSANYSTDRGDALLLHRPIITAQFPTHAGPLPRRCIIDTGAPLSIVPYDVWHIRKLNWSAVSKSLSGRGGRNVLMWQGVPCQLGEMQIDLAGPRVLVAKFALQPTQPFDVILGMNFLADNGLELYLKPVAAGFNGTLVV